MSCLLYCPWAQAGLRLCTMDLHVPPFFQSHALRLGSSTEYDRGDAKVSGLDGDMPSTRFSHHVDFDGGVRILGDSIHIFASSWLDAPKEVAEPIHERGQGKVNLGILQSLDLRACRHEPMAAVYTRS